MSQPIRRAALITGTLAAVAAVTALAAVSLHSRADAGPAPSGGVTLRVGDQKAGSKALLSAAGFLTGLPYRIEWSQFAAGPPLLEAVNAGAVDVGGVGDTPPIFAAAGGSKITLVAATRSTPNGAAILVAKDSPIRSLADLRGRKVAVAKGSSANYHLLAALQSVGLSLADITPTYLTPPDALSAFSSGTVDAWVIWDPYTAIAQAQTGARILVDGNGLVGGLGFQVAAPGALADPAKAAAIRDYLGRLARARVWTDTHHDEWATAWAKEAGIPRDVAAVSVGRTKTLPVVIDDALIKEEQAEADAFHKAGLIPRQVDVAAIADRRFNATAEDALRGS